MLQRLQASDERFKPVQFKPGLNLIVADTTGESRETDTRNGAGKSSILEIVHFLLGARSERGSLLARYELRDIEFRLNLDWKSSPTGVLEVRRSTEKANDIYLDHDVRQRRLLGDAPVRIGLVEWQRIIERDLFNFPAERGGLSGRSILSLYIRRVSANALNEAVRTSPQQTLADAATNVAYLLGLDWQLASRYKELSARESTRRQLSAAAKDPVWGRIVGRSSELRGQITVAQQRVNELEKQLSEFRVVPEYENLQSQADQINQRIRQMRVDDLADRQIWVT